MRVTDDAARVLDELLRASGQDECTLVASGAQQYSLHIGHEGGGAEIALSATSAGSTSLWVHDSLASTLGAAVLRRPRDEHAETPLVLRCPQSYPFGPVDYPIALETEHGR